MRTVVAFAVAAALLASAGCGGDRLPTDDAAPLPESYSAPRWLPRGPIRSLVRRGLTPADMKELFTHPAFWKACLPAMNGVCTSRSLAKMYAALSLGGGLDGVRLLDAETIRKASEVQMKRPDRVVLYPLHWRLGYHRVLGNYGACPRGFGHFGLGGSGAWADPSRELAVAMVCNRGTGTPVGDIRLMRLSRDAIESADRVAAAAAPVHG